MRVLSFRWLRRRWVSTPAIAQAQVTECGVASLAIILAHHGRFVSLEELRRATGVSRDGTSAQDLLRAARDQGLTAKIHRAEPERLAALGFPLIVHLDFIHFVVVEGMTATHVLVNDPAGGRCDIPREDFHERFTGIALTFAPPADFRPAGGPVRVGQALARRLAPAWGTLALLALVGLLLAVPLVLFAVLLGRFVDAALTLAEPRSLWPLGLGLFGAVALAAVLGVAAEALLGRTEARLGRDETRALLRHLQTLPATFFSYRYSGSLRELVLSGDALAQSVCTHLLRPALQLAALPAMAIALFAYDAPLAAVLLGLGAVYLLTLWGLYRRHDVADRSAATGGDAPYGSAWLSFERLEGFKTAGRDGEYFAGLAGTHARALETARRRAGLRLRLDLLPRAVDAVAALAVLGLGSLAVARGSATAGTLVALYFLAQRLLLPLRQLVASAGGWEQIATQVRILEEALAVPADPRLAQGEAVGADPPGRVVGPLRLRGVSFGYAPRQPPLLRDVNLDVAPAEQLGIVAPSAGGKSTLAGLLVGLHRPWAGRVELAGRPLDELPSAVLAHSVGWLPKAPLLFQGTVRENLSLWGPSVGEEALRAAVRDAELSEVLAQRAGGLDSPVDHRGRNLSGGQRLRLELARVLARDPALIVVDEAFDALELPLEEAIRANLRRRGCALVLISQRAESLGWCDRTVVLEHGTVAENGAAAGAETAGFQLADAPRQVENSPPQEPDDIAPIDPWARPCRGLAAAFRAVAAAVGETVKVIDDAPESVPQLAQVTGLRVRRVRFRRDDWWRDDHGPLLALRDDDTALALLPQASGYVCFDPVAGSRRRLTAADAARLARTAFMIYDRSWQQVRRPWDLLRQAALAARGDLALVVLTALAAALLTAVAPLAGASLVGHWRTAVLAGIALAAAGLLLCDAIGTAARRRFQARAEHGAFAALWERVIRLPASFLRRHGPADLERRSECLGEAVAMVTGSPLSQLLGGAALLVSLLVLVVLAPPAALVVLVLLPPAVAVPALIERRAMAEDRRWFEKAVHNRTFLLDLLTGMARLRALGGADRLCDRWEDDYRALKARDARLRRSAGGRRVFGEACSLIVPAASVVAVAWAGVGAGAFVGCHLAAGQAAAAALGLGAVAAAVIRARYLLERAGPLLTTALEEREGKRPAAPLRGTLEGHDLHFRYEGSTARALDGVSVRVGPGEIVALAGPSGSGKSTLLRMLLGFEEPARGVVCWDGVPLAELDPHAVRAQVGAVLQEDRLMEGTTRFNIGGLSPPPKVALWEAARLAVVDDDIRRWPMQMETLLDEEKVSGSQRQRILLAGQLLRRPLLVLLDEATSALDEEVQARLFANLRGLRLPCVVVAHRPSTLWYADRIYRLHEGRVVQSGTPAEVLGEGAPPAVPPAEVWPADAEAVPLRILFRRAALERYLGPISPDAPATRPHLRFPLPTGS